MEGHPALLGPRRLRELLDRHGVRPKKSLGQNFVVDPNTIRKVVETASVDPEDRVLEIGPGAGSLTLGLAPRAAHVTAVEVDTRLLPVLEDVLASTDNVSVIQADAMEMDLGAIDADKVVANLPYNVATPVVLRLLEEAPRVRDLVVMTQKEVGERLAAPPGSKTYGAPTVAVGFFATARIAASISRRAFWPVPNVDSVLIHVTRRAEPLGTSYGELRTVLRAAFGQRRKSLRNSLAAMAGGTAEAEAALATALVDPAFRPEQLDTEAFVRVSEALSRD